MPHDLAGLRAHREYGGRVQVVPRAALRGPRRRVADAPVHQVERRVVRAGDPGRAAARFPGVVVLRPAVVALLAARGDGVTAPELLAGLRVPAVDEAAHAVLRAGDAGDQHAVGDERGDGEREAVLPLGGLRLPDLLAGLG